MFLNKWNSKSIEMHVQRSLSGTIRFPLICVATFKSDIHGGVLSLWTLTDSRRTVEMHGRVEHGASFGIILNDVLL